MIEVKLRRPVGICTYRVTENGIVFSVIHRQDCKEFLRRERGDGDVIRQIRALATEKRRDLGSAVA